jgi:hypothetical protein
VSLVQLEPFKGYLGVTRGADIADDELVQDALDAATSAINDCLQRDIALAGVVATPRSYPSRLGPLLFIDDCVSITSVVDDITTLTTDQYQPEPLGQRDRSGGYRPFSEIRRRGGWFDSQGWAVITVTATWGWATIPGAVTEACKILAKDILANRDVNFGIAAVTEYAGIRARSNPQVWGLLQPYSLRTGVG